MKRLLTMLLLASACDGAATMALPTTEEPPPPKPTEKTWVFDATGAEGPALRVSGDVTPDALTVAIDAAELDPVYGLAFRVAYDPAVLRFEGLDADAWPLLEIAEARPGEVVVAMSGVGPFEPRAPGRLGLATFTRVAQEETFVAVHRAVALDVRGEARDVAAWRGSLVLQ